MTHDLSGILDDARRLDLLASGSCPDDPAVALLSDLRRALEPTASQHLQPRRRRRLWSRGVAVALIATALPLAGVTGAAAAAHPGDVLYSVRRTVIGRTSDDPWAARQLVEQARLALPPVWAAAASPVQVDRAELLLDQARASARNLRQADAQDLSRRIGHLEHRIRESREGRAVSRSHRVSRSYPFSPAGRAPSHPRPAARRRRSR